MKKLRFAATLLALLSVSSAMRAEDNTVKPPDSGYLVTLELSVNETGHVEKAVVKESDDEILNMIAVNTAKTWQLKPRMMDGQAVKYVALAPLAFPVEGDGGVGVKGQPKPQPKFRGLPSYPVELRRQAVTGAAIIEFQVSANGKLTGVRALRATRSEFADSAIKAVNEWKFSPAQSKGKSVETKLSIAILFLIDGASPPPLEWFLAPRPCLDRFTVMGSYR